jgi:hypothetical protein
MTFFYPGNKKSASKYRAIKTEVDGVVFASKKEASRYVALKLRLAAHQITDLELHPAYLIVINGVKICKYIADFRYFDKAMDKQVIEDVKGVRTPVFNIKKKLVEAVYGIEVVLV